MARVSRVSFYLDDVSEVGSIDFVPMCSALAKRSTLKWEARGCMVGVWQPCSWKAALEFRLR